MFSLRVVFLDLHSGVETIEYNVIDETDGNKLMQSASVAGERLETVSMK